jgi:large repetitive protein
VPPATTYSVFTDGSFSVSGSAERGSTVELFEGTTSKGTTKADSSSGAWSIALSKVSDGAHTYTAKATNAAGTSNASSPVNITVDTVKPSAPTIDSPKDNSIDTDGIISFDGYTEKESTVRIYQDGLLLLRASSFRPAITVAGGRSPSTMLASNRQRTLSM